MLDKCSVKLSLWFQLDATKGYMEYYFGSAALLYMVSIELLEMS